MLVTYGGVRQQLLAEVSEFEAGSEEVAAVHSRQSFIDCFFGKNTKAFTLSLFDSMLNYKILA